MHEHEEIRRAVYNPPKDTRAFFRGECLRRYPNEVFGVNWDSISFGLEDESIKRIMMAEPLKGTSEFVEELLDRSETAAKLLENMEAGHRPSALRSVQSGGRDNDDFH